MKFQTIFLHFSLSCSVVFSEFIRTLSFRTTNSRALLFLLFFVFLGNSRHWNNNRIDRVFLRCVCVKEVSESLSVKCWFCFREIARFRMAPDKLRVDLLGAFHMCRWYLRPVDSEENICREKSEEEAKLCEATFAKFETFRFFIIVTPTNENLDVFWYRYS